MKTQLHKMAAGALALFMSGSAFAQITFSDQTTLLPTSTFHSGNGIGVCDMNNDKKDDIVRALNNSTQYVEFQQAPNAAFTELSSPTANIGDPWGMACGDFNNDGYTDVTWGDGYGYTRILHWNGINYTATNVTTLTGATPDFPQGCNFADINNDGFLDAFTCNDDMMPDVFQGNGTPTGWISNQALIPLATSPASDNSGNYASIFTDINNDGYIDLMITHCRQGVTNSSDARRIDQVFINNGNGTYTQDVTNWTNLRDGAQGWSTASGDIDNDGDMDLFVMNYDVNSHMWVNNGSGVFSDIMSTSGISATTSFFGTNATFHDFDNDGFVDLLITGDQHFIYHNNGNSTFTAVAPNPFPYSTHKAAAIAVGDLNYDGRLDCYASYCDLFQSPSASRMDKLWMNTSTNANHYVVFDLIGGGTSGMSNSSAIGAIVKIYGGWGVQVREVRGGEAYGVQNTLAVHFGLGMYTSIDSVVVIWPSGIVDRPWSNPVDQHNTINEGAFPTQTPAAYYHPFQMVLSPNPAFTDVHVQLFNVDQYGLENLTLQIVDVNGRVVYSEASLTSNDITISHDLFATGLYMVDVSKGDEHIATEKLIVR